MADSSEDDYGDAVSVQREEAEVSSRSFGISSILLFVFSCILYLYVLACLFLTLVVPASITPILRHPVHLNLTNKTNGTSDGETYYVAGVSIRNAALLVLFLVQHTFFPRYLVERCLSTLKMTPFLRSFYALTTCVTLQVINRFWTPILPQYHLWNCTYDTTLFFVVMTTVHLFCWISVGFSVFVFDYLELFGIKQLYYYGSEPMRSKADDHRDLLQHMRHPLVLAPLVMLWCVPFMTYDRLLVSIMVPTYLLWGNRVADEDNHYVQNMFRMKKRFLLHGKMD